MQRYCELFQQGADQEGDADFVIDMDAVADAAGKDGEKPAFYMSDESQQRQFTCTACEQFNDILGQFGYCSLCGMRNDRDLFESETVVKIRERLNSGGDPNAAVQDAVSAFDTVAGQYGKQLARMVPMTRARRNRLESQRYHDPIAVAALFREWFDIDILHGMKPAEVGFVKLRFHRRHLFEHNGGEVDQKYLDESGDTSVRLKQSIRESMEDAHSLTSSLVKMVRNLHKGFHEVIPPLSAPIKASEERKARIARYQSGQR